SATEGQKVRLPPALMQPIAADDIAAVVADVALSKPLNGTFELAGPERIRQDDLVRQFLTATGEERTVITDRKAFYYGIEVNDQSLIPGNNPRIGPTRFEDWLRRSTHQRRATLRRQRLTKFVQSNRPTQTVLSNSKNAVSFSSARTMKRRGKRNYWDM